MKLETTSTNVFMSMIKEKNDTRDKGYFKRLKHEKKVRKFRDDILTGSPSFGLLWRMADFIKLAEDCFFYKNCLDNNEIGLFSSRSYSKGQNGFKLWDNDISMTIKLISDSQKVIIEIDKPWVNGGNAMSKTTLSFINEQWEDEPTIYSELLLESVIRKINSKIITLFDIYYDKW